MYSLPHRPTNAPAYDAITARRPLVGACAQIGCDDGIFLAIEDPSGTGVETFSGSVTIDDQVIEVTCTSTGGSGDGYLCLGSTLQVTGTFDVTEIALNISSTNDPSLRYVGGLALEFEEHQPNGPDCPPTCIQADHTVSLETTQAQPQPPLE